MSKDIAQLFQELYTCVGNNKFKWEGHELKRGRIDISETLRALL